MTTIGLMSSHDGTFTVFKDGKINYIIRLFEVYFLNKVILLKYWLGI